MLLIERMFQIPLLHVLIGTSSVRWTEKRIWKTAFYILKDDILPYYSLKIWIEEELNIEAGVIKTVMFYKTGEEWVKNFPESLVFMFMFIFCFKKTLLILCSFLNFRFDYFLYFYHNYTFFISNRFIGN